MKSRIESTDSLSASRRLIRRWSGKWHAPHLVDQVTCEWSSRLTRSLGRAYPTRMLVRLNRLLQREPYLPLFEEVLCHEVAHVAVYVLHGSLAASHGVEWKQLLTLAGFEPRRELFIETNAARNPGACRYQHTCPVCQATRIAKSPHPRWRCITCRDAGLEGTLVIHSLPARSEAQDV